MVVEPCEFVQNDAGRPIDALIFSMSDEEMGKFTKALGTQAELLPVQAVLQSPVGALSTQW